MYRTNRGTLLKVYTEGKSVPLTLMWKLKDLGYCSVPFLTRKSLQTTHLSLHRETEESESLIHVF